MPAIDSQTRLKEKAEDLIHLAAELIDKDIFRKFVLLSLMLASFSFSAARAGGILFWEEPIYINPDHFTIAIQEGNWRDYNFTTLIIPYNPIEPLHPLYREEGQTFHVSVINITDLSIKYTIQKFLVNGSIFGAIGNGTVSRSTLPSFHHYVTTTNVTLLTQGLGDPEFPYEIHGQELIVQWIRNATTYPYSYDENVSFIEEWNIDLSTGWRNSYTNLLIDNGVYKRHIVQEVFRSNPITSGVNSTPTTLTTPEALHSTPFNLLSFLQILALSSILFFFVTLVIIFHRRQMS
jgi:hypothetical protein